MAQVPTGTTFFIASAFGSAINTTAVTNASEAVVTTASAHSFSNGDIVEVTSGWGRLNKRAFRIKAASGSTLTLDGTVATPVVGLGDGIRNISTMLNITRTWNAAMSARHRASTQAPLPPQLLLPSVEQSAPSTTASGPTSIASCAATEFSDFASAVASVTLP